MLLKEALLIIQKLSLRRLINILKLLMSYFLSRWSGRPYHWGKPMSLSVEPTTACNLECPQCPSGLRSFSRPVGNLRFENFVNYTTSSLKDLSFMTFYFQGEPFINGDLLRMIEFASKAGVYTMSSTNAHFLTPQISAKVVLSGLDRLVISIDGVTQEVYQQYRINGELDKVIQGIRNILNVRKELQKFTPLVVLQFIVFRHNEHQIEHMKKLYQNLGADRLEFKSAQVYNYQMNADFIPEESLYSRYQPASGGGYIIKNRLLNHCWRMWSAAVITWDGRVVPCCFDKDAQHVLGDVNKEKLSAIWSSATYYQFRSSLLKGRNKIDICKNCTEGLLV